MSALLGWGSGYYVGDTGPHTAPFLVANTGAIVASLDGTDYAYDGFRSDGFAFGVTEAAPAPITVTITFLPAGGGAAVVTSRDITVNDGDGVYLNVATPGLYEITATADGAEIQNKLIASVSPVVGNGGPGLPSVYGGVAWYEEALTTPAFWTQLVNALEIRN